MVQSFNQFGGISDRISATALLRLTAKLLPLFSAVTAAGLLAAGPVLAQTTSTPEQEDAATADSLRVSTSTEALRINPQFRVGAITESGGIPASLNAFDGFFPVLQTPGTSITYLNPRLNIDFDDENRLGGSLLFGHRSYSPDQQRILGGYLGLDVRDTGENVFPQIGFGFERLGKHWDIRANGYVPVGDTRQRIDREVFASSQTSIAIGEPTFSGNLLSSNVTSTTTDTRTQIDRLEAALGGFDVEAGTRLVSWNEHGEMRLYGGLYYLGGHDVSSIGGRGRLEIVPTESIRLMAGIQGDPVFDVRGFFSASFLLPTPKALQTDTDPDEKAEAIATLGETVTRLADPVARDFNVVVEEQQEVDTTVATTSISEEFVFRNPETGAAWRFTHVTSGGNSDGTFEDPFGTLEEALVSGLQQDGNDVVYVRLGDEAIPGIDLIAAGVQNIQILSDGPLQTLPIQPFNGESTVEIPFSNRGQLTQVTAPVVLNNNITIDGFDINPGAGFTAVSGTDIAGTINLRDNRITSDGADAIAIVSSENLTLNADNNQVEVAGGGAVDGLFVQSNNDAQAAINLTNNQVSGGGRSIHLEAVDTSSLSTLIEGNTVSTDTSDGIRIRLLDEAMGTATIARNEVGSTGAQGIDLDVRDDATFDDVKISRNTINGSGAAAIRLITRGSNLSQANLSITDNTITDAGANGINIDSRGSSSSRVTATGNTITGTVNNGIRARATDSANVSLTANKNDISQTGGNGILLLTEGTSSSLSASIFENTIDTVGVNGIRLFTDDSSVSDVELVNNQITNAAGRGIDLLIRDFSDTTASILNNTVSVTGQDGVRVRLRQNNSTGRLDIQNNTVTSASGRGFDVDHDGATVCVNLEGNTSIMPGGDDYRLRAAAGNPGDMYVVNLATVDTLNLPVSSITFTNDGGNFINLPSLDACPLP